MPYIFEKKIKNCTSDIIWAQCFVRVKPFRFKKNNWGDDLNKYMFETITGSEVVFLPYDWIYCSNQHYSLIGSILSYYNLDNTIVYGSGLKRASELIKGKPLKILSVRGPRTRNELLKRGIDCPEKYGDPALLLSAFYYTPKRKIERGLLIANEGTNRAIGSDKIAEMADKINCDVLDMTDYDKWTDPVDAICSHKYIVSESLHGLIVAETYGIPSVWVELIRHDKEWDFKYLDFYESIGKFNMKSVKLYENEQIKDEEIIREFKPMDRTIVEDMLLSFPFPIRKQCSERKHV